MITYLNQNSRVTPISCGVGRGSKADVDCIRFETQDGCTSIAGYVLFRSFRFSPQNSPNCKTNAMRCACPFLFFSFFVLLCTARWIEAKPTLDDFLIGPISGFFAIDTQEQVKVIVHGAKATDGYREDFVEFL
jgi:hypothetical protein